MASSSPSVLSASRVMASGTVVSRITGLFRALLLVAAIGNVGAHPDIFNVANTIPNSLYILVAGGVFNAVLVPQLVRATRNDADRGDAYANRIITLGALVLASVTVVLIVLAPGCCACSHPATSRTLRWPPRRSRSSRSRATAFPRSSSTACSCWSARSSTRGAGSAR